MQVKGAGGEGEGEQPRALLLLTEQWKCDKFFMLF